MYELIMKKLLLILCLFLMTAHAQNNLPPCSGDYRNNCYGVGVYNNGKYVGQFKDGKRNGQGTYFWASGSKYEGQYKDGKRNGQGTFTWTNGDKYVGQFINDNRTGQGTYTWTNGDKYVGQFINENRTGQGTYTFANGNKYVGQFKDNKYDGFGTLYNTNGSIFQQGLWRDNEFVQVQSPPVVPKPPVNNAQDIKRQKCIRLGLVPGTNDFQQCLN